MTSNVVNQVSNELKNQVSSEIKSTLSEILPYLNQLLQFYQVSSTLEIHLFDLTGDLLSNPGSCLCRGIIQNPCRCTPLLPPDSPGLELDAKKAQQFCTDFDSILSTILPRLSQAANQIEESFEVHFLFDPATVNSGQPVACEWSSDGTLKCSNFSGAENLVMQKISLSLK